MKPNLAKGEMSLEVCGRQVVLAPTFEGLEEVFSTTGMGVNYLLSTLRVGNASLTNLKDIIQSLAKEDIEDEDLKDFLTFKGPVVQASLAAYFTYLFTQQPEGKPKAAKGKN